MANSIADRATAKIGPLPVWGWAIIVVGGVWVFHLVRLNRDSATGSIINTGPDAFTTEPNVPPAAPVDNSPTDTVPTIGNNIVTNNQQWRYLVAKGLAASGYGGIEIQQALNAYFEGKFYTLPERLRDMLDKALAVYGEPPEPPTLGNVPTVPIPKPTATRWVTTGKFGSHKGDWVQNYEWLVNHGYATKRGTEYFSTKKLGATEHKISFAWLKGIGFITQKAA